LFQTTEEIHIFLSLPLTLLMQASKGTLKNLPLACLLLDDWCPRGSGIFHGSSKISCEWTFLPRLMFDFCRQMLNDHLATWKNMDRFET
jgi:hypothetical protein